MNNQPYPSLVIIKIGGNVIDNKNSLDTFLRNFSTINVPKILIHGGGKIATQIGDKMNIESKYFEGRRITDEPTLDLVTMVYGGLVNKKMVAQLQRYNCNCLGLTGGDMNLIPAKKRSPNPIDYGFVGDVIIEKINIDFINLLLRNNITPIIAPLASDLNGGLLNTNADTIASTIAIALSKYYNIRLVYCFEKKGILEDIQNENSVINKIDKQYYEKLLLQKKLFDGILPKLSNAFNAIQQGVKEVLIGHSDDIYVNATQEKTIGTLLYN